MKRPDPPTLTGHPDDLLLPYVEGRLTPEDKIMVEEHLRMCPRCAAEAEEIRGLVAALKEKKRAFCPEPAVLFEAAKSTMEPREDLSMHLAECAACREELESYRNAPAREAIPLDLWRKLEGRVPQQPQGRETSHGGRVEADGLWHRLMRWPAFSAAAAAAVAAVLLVVVLFPRGDGDMSVGLSAITWEAAPRPKTAMAGDRSPLALVILFKGFPKSMPQREVDALYQALEPTMELNERYRIVSPADLSRALAGRSKARLGKKEIVASLKKRLDVSTAVLVTISPSGTDFTVEADLVDATRGNSLRQRTADGVSRSDLGARLKQEVNAVLLQ